MHIGHRINSLRTEQGIPLPTLAEKAGISKGLLYSIENAEKEPNPSLDTLNKISKALGITVAELLGRGAVQSKRQLPERIVPELKKMIEAMRKESEPVNEAALDALYVLQEREGAPKTAEDWQWLYRSICMSLESRK
jgi:transcriptional regulator with XRE-family HTH domain